VSAEAQQPVRVVLDDGDAVLPTDREHLGTPVYGERDARRVVERRHRIEELRARSYGAQRSA
jgi:hypothetical protein